MRTDNGFTLIELMVTTVLMAIVGALTVTSLVGYARAQDHQSTADEVVSVLRTTAQRALSEGRTHCVSFDTAAGTWTVHRTDCAAGPVVGSGDARSGIDLQSASFTLQAAHSCSSGTSCVYFTPRGTASPGTVAIARDTDVITVTVEGLSSRVSRS